jgi:hypothetical protein
LPWFHLLSEVVNQKATDNVSGTLLHIASGVGIGIQSEGRFGVAQDSRQGFGVHAAGQRMS